MATTTVGAVWLNVLPSMRDFTKKLTGDATKAATEAAKKSGSRLGSDMVDEAAKEVGRGGTKAAKEAGEKVAREVGQTATKELPKQVGKAGQEAGKALAAATGKAASHALPNVMGSAGTAAGRTLADAAGKAAAHAIPNVMGSATAAATRDAMTAVAKTTGNILPAALSQQAGKAGEQAGAAMSKAMAQSYQPPAPRLGGWVSGAAASARQAGSAAMSSLGSTISSAGAGITTVLTGVVGGAIAAASREGVAQAGQAWSSAGSAMAAAGQQTTMSLSAPMAAFGTLTLKTAGDFEQQMNRVRAVSGATGGEFQGLNDLARELGSTTQYSASEAADAMGFLAMAGFDTDQIMSALPGTLDLAASGAIDLAEAADIASNILTGYGFQADELGRVNDVLAKTFTSSNVNMTQLGYSFKYVGPIANSAGVQFEELSAAIGMLGNAGIQAEQAGTSLRGGISRLLKPTGAVSEALDGLGVSVNDSSGQMLPLADIFEQLEKAGASTSDMITIFGLEAGPGMMALLDQGSEAMRDFTAELEDAGGTAGNIADIQMEGLNGAIREMKSAFQELLLAVADSGMLETVTNRVDSLTAVISDLGETNPELLNTAAGFAGFLAALGPIIWIGGRVVSTIGMVITGVSAVGTGLSAVGATAAGFLMGWRNINAAFAANATFATRLGAALRAQILLWNQQAAATGRSTAAQILHNTWTRIVRGATALWTGAQWALNAALNANPIGLVVIAIVALVGGVMLAYKHSEVFREFVDDLWASAQELWKHLEPLVPVFLKIAKVSLAITFAPLIGAFLAIRAVGRAAFEFLRPAFEWLSDFWSGTLQPKVVQIGEVFDRAWGKVETGWRLLTGLFSGEVAFSDISGAVRRHASAAGDWLKGQASEVGSWLAARGRDVLAWIKDLPRMIWEGGTGLGESLLGLLQTILDPENLTQIGKDIAGHITGGLDWLLDQAQELPAKLRPKLDAVVTGIVTWAQELPGRIEAKVEGLAEQVSAWASEVGPKVVEKLRDTGENIAAWFQELPGRVQDWVDIDAFVAWAVEIPGRIQDAIDIDAAVAWVLTMKDRAVEKLGEVVAGVVEWAQELPDKIRTAIDNAAKVKDWFVEWGPKILAGLGIAILVVVLAIPALIFSIGAAILFVLGIIVMELGQWLWEKFTGLMVTVGLAISSKVAEITGRFREIRDQAVGYVTNLYTRVTGFFANLRTQGVTRVRELRDQALALVANLRDQAVARALALRDRVVSALINARDRGVGAVRGLRDQAAALVANARDWVVSRVTTLRDRAVGVLEDFRDKAISAFKRAKSGIETAWKKVESVTKKPITFLVNTVYNDGIRATWNKVAGLVNMDTLPKITGFAAGGILPGYTPGRDPHKFISPTGGRLELSGGEAIMRPEFTRAVGPGWVNAVNAAARSGGTTGVQSVLGFANGGVYPGPVQAFNEGGIFGRVAAFGSSLKDIFDGDGLASAARTVLDPLVETMRGRFTEGRFQEAMVKIPGAMIGKLVTWLEDTVGGMLGGTGKAVADNAGNYLGVSGNPNQFTRAFGMNGLAWCAMFVSEMIKEVKAGKAYSNVRSAAVTSFANSSMKSVSGVGNTRPGDLAVYSGSGPGGWQHINIIVDDKGTTIGGNESNAVRKSFGYSSSAAKFMRPKAFADGGLWWQDSEFNTPRTTPPLTRTLQAFDQLNPTLYDSGGWLMPGLQLVANATGRPEPVLTDRQWDDLRNRQERPGRERPNTTYNITETRDPRVTVKKVMTAQSDWDALHPA